MLELRPYQIAALDALRQKVRCGRRRLVLISPTGSGKTVLVAEMLRSAAAKGNTSLVAVHRREIVEQTHARFVREGLSAGIVMAGHEPHPLKPIQVGSVQSLTRRKLPDAKILVIDECHHARAKTHEKLIAAYPDALILGMTASPWRMDGRGLGDLFEESVVAATPAELIAAGYLADYQGFAFMAPDISKVRTVAGDFDEKQLGAIYGESRIVGDVVSSYLKHANGRRAILFASTIENSKAFVAAFKASGIAAEHLDYKVPLAERDAIMSRVRSGETTLISNVGILGEGVDVPELEVVILARPTKSVAFYLQAIGRVLRPKAGKALILDHAECVVRHGLPDEERDYSLTASKRPSPPSLHTCKNCFAIWAQGLICPQCGYAAPVQAGREGPENVDGVAVDIRQIKPAEMKRVRDALYLEAIARGHKPGWAVHKYLEHFPGAPRPWGLFRAIKETQG